MMRINNSVIGVGNPVYIIAELSANHNQDFQRAVQLMEAAKAAGADAIKLQTYTADTLTLNSNQPYFQIKDTIWDGRNLYSLYQEAFTPWEWQPKLKQIADDMGVDLFSTPFDFSAVDFLEAMNVPAYKIASFENVDIPLIKRVAQTGKPIIMSTGMATLAEIDEAVRAVRDAGGTEMALLKCTSSYPAPPDQAYLAVIPHLAQAFDVPVGLSDHTMDVAVPVVAVTLGACIIEKHFTLDRAEGGPDSAFSLEPREFRAMVDSVRIAERAVGTVQYGPTPSEITSLAFRRSLFVVQDIKAGEIFTEQNVRSIRPSNGMHTRYLADILGRRATKDITKGTPLSWDLMAPLDKTIE